MMRGPDRRSGPLRYRIIKVRHCEPTGRANARPMPGSPQQASLGASVRRSGFVSSQALLAMTGYSRRRELLRREAAVEGLVLCRHLDQEFWRSEARAVFGFQPVAELDEFLG